MDHFKILYTFFFTVTVLVKNIFSLTVSMNQNPIGNLDSEADIVCSYSPQQGDFVLTILIKKEEGTSFVPIATFFAPSLNQNATFVNTTTGKDLAKRAELTNPLASNNFAASLKINTVECRDETTYKCSVSYVAAGSTLIAESTNSLTVKGRAKLPDTIPIMNPTENIVADTDVYFTCTGDVGKPAGTLIWQKYKNDTAVSGEISGVATTQPIDGKCTVNKTSTIKLRLTKDDDLTVVRCTVQQELVGNTFFKQTEQIRIFYEVNKPIFQRDPPDSEILVGTKITLTCSARGHPVPTYVWYDSNDNKLKEGPTFEIQNANVSNSGIYKCTASNTYPFNGLTFNQTSSTMVNIVLPTTTEAVPSTSEGATKTPTSNVSTTVDAILSTTNKAALSTSEGSTETPTTKGLTNVDAILSTTNKAVLSTSEGATKTPTTKGPTNVDAILPTTTKYAPSTIEMTTKKPSTKGQTTVDEVLPSTTKAVSFTPEGFTRTPTTQRQTPVNLGLSQGISYGVIVFVVLILIVMLYCFC